MPRKLHIFRFKNSQLFLLLCTNIVNPDSWILRRKLHLDLFCPVLSLLSLVLVVFQFSCNLACSISHHTTAGFLRMRCECCCCRAAASGASRRRDVTRPRSSCLLATPLSQQLPRTRCDFSGRTAPKSERWVPTPTCIASLTSPTSRKTDFYFVLIAPFSERQNASSTLFRQLERVFFSNFIFS